MPDSLSQPLRILYASGAGNVIGTYNYWVEGQDDPSQVSITYSAQFYELCCDLDAQAYVISSCEERKFLHDGRFMIEHRPFPWRRRSKLLYHLGQFWYGLWLVASALRFRANVAVVADGTTHWFVLSLLCWLGIKAVPSIHTALWRKYGSQSISERLILMLSRNLFAQDCFAILAISDLISEQVAQLTDGRHQPILRCFPIYRRTEFAGVGEPDDKRSPFRVLFVGRIEADKGVFDLIEISKRFAALDRHDIKFDVCGNGSALESLQRDAKLARVDSFLVFHGHCNKPQMQQMFNQACVVIVPTRTDFIEGFNKVVIEGVLSGRPVVTSAVCPALSCVREAVVEVPPDDPKAYGDALIRLCDDREFYEEKRRGARALQDQFYDSSRSWGAALKSILVAIQKGKNPEEEWRADSKQEVFSSSSTC